LSRLTLATLPPFARSSKSARRQAAEQ